MVLTPNVLRICTRLGIYSKIREVTFSHNGVDLVNMNEDQIGTFVLGEEKRFGYPALCLYRAFLRNTILVKAEKRSIKKSIDGNKASTGFSSGEQVDTDLMVNVNSIYSLVRNYLYPQGRTSDLDIAKVILGPKGSFVRMPVTGKNGDILFFSTIEVPDRSPEEWRMLDFNKGELVRLLARFDSEERLDVVKGLIKDIYLKRYYSWLFNTVLNLEKWYSEKQRLVILSDVTHAISLSVNQGVRMSLENTVTLAIVILHVKDIHD
ncbi:hypothetical protein F5884DRAFT_883709 [Xylogone sp. PMI_703]|nr:hypothetical protein F5884DRAFT_883709 [Xylogone sp. PMI_703]